MWKNAKKGKSYGKMQKKNKVFLKMQIRKKYGKCKN